MSLTGAKLFAGKIAGAIFAWQFLVAGTLAGEEPIMIDLGWRSVEHAETRLSLSGPGTGVLVARCFGCVGAPWLRLKINGHSKVFLNRQEITFKQSLGLNAELQSVHYEFDGLVLREWHLSNLD